MKVMNKPFMGFLWVAVVGVSGAQAQEIDIDTLANIEEERQAVLDAPTVITGSGAALTVGSLISATSNKIEEAKAKKVAASIRELKETNEKIVEKTDKYKKMSSEMTELERGRLAGEISDLRRHAVNLQAPHLKQENINLLRRLSYADQVDMFKLSPAPSRGLDFMETMAEIGKRRGVLRSPLTIAAGVALTAGGMFLGRNDQTSPSEKLVKASYEQIAEVETEQPAEKSH